jgi:hypothetical protein
MPFAPGNNANPRGRPPSAINYQIFKDRASLIFEKYEPNELIQLGNQIAAGKKVNVSSFDALIIVNLSSALQKDGKERERLLDRLLGKAVIRIGGETPDKPIQIARSINLEDMDTETLLELKALIDRAKNRVTIDNTPTLPPMIEGPLDE